MSASDKRPSRKRPPAAPLLDVPTAQERADAFAAAAALRAAFLDPSTMGARSTIHLDFSRPRRAENLTSWANIPGFVRASGGRYTHALLPGWEYARREVRAEMIPDLEALAERGVRPTEATRS